MFETTNIYLGLLKSVRKNLSNYKFDFPDKKTLMNRLYSTEIIIEICNIVVYQSFDFLPQGQIFSLDLKQFLKGFHPYSS